VARGDSHSLQKKGIKVARERGENPQKKNKKKQNQGWPGQKENTLASRAAG